MCAFLFHNWQKPVGVFITAVMLAGLIVQPATAADNMRTWFTLEILPVTQYMCLNRKVKLTYILKFNRQDYEEEMQKKKLAPLEPLVPIGGTSDDVPRMEFTESQGTVFDKELQAKDDPIIRLWREEITFIPDHVGDATIRIKARYRGAADTDKWEIKVEPCKYDIEIHADQTSIKGIEETKKVWDLRSWWEGYARVISDPIDQGSGSGGNQRPVFSESFTSHKEDATGTLEYFWDGIYVSNSLGDFETCWVEGAHICSLEFTVHPVHSDETIDFQFDIASGQCTLPTTVCKDEHGLVTGYLAAPPTVQEREMNAVIPWEGGSTHYIDELPYGMSIDYLISAFPVEEE